MAQPPAEAGAWYCPAAADPQEPAAVSVAAVGDRPSTVTVVHYGPDGATVDPAVAVAPGQPVEVALPAGQAAQPVVLRWRGGPTVATWRAEGGQRTGAPCAAAPSATWHLAGFDTRLGAVSKLHLFNPFAEDAVATVTFGTPQGRQTLVRTQNIVVPAGRMTTLALNELQPEVSDLGANVQVLAGRVVAQGEVRFDPPDDEPGLTGRTLLPAAPAPSLEWSFGFARADDNSSSWLEVLNPGDDEAAVRLQVSDPHDGGAALAEEVSVPAGGMVRVDLAEASAQPDFGVAVTSVNDVPVVVSRFTAVRGDGGSAVAAALGADRAATRWALVGGGTARRSARVSLYNPSPQPASVDVLAAGAPPTWTGVQLPPNARTVIDLAEAGADRPTVPVLVQASVPVVAELRSLSEHGGLGLWTAVGVAADDWSGPPLRPPVRRDPSLPARPLPVDTSEPVDAVAAPQATAPATSEVPPGG
ncbi:MAG TPA: DUF5719 family protein [Egibacteraceae bacterium]|nr:DUF5719 family protein [Egibacteraceae bacterium]